MSMLTVLGFFLGLGAIPYALKNEYDAVTRDIMMTPRSLTDNTAQIDANFKKMCKKLGIKLRGNTTFPLKMSDMDIGVRFLKKQGFTKSDIGYFKTKYKSLYDQGKWYEEDRIKWNNYKTNQQIKKANNDNTRQIVFRQPVFNTHGMTAQQRMDKLLENPLWKDLVHHSWWVVGDGITKYEEIWVLEVPKEEYIDIDRRKDEIYKNICKEQGVLNTF